MDPFNKIAERYAHVRPTYPRQISVGLLGRD